MRRAWGCPAANTPRAEAHRVLAVPDAWQSWLAWSAAALWLILIVLPWRPWWPGPRLETKSSGRIARTGGLREVTALVPARDESAVLPATLPALLAQDPALQVVVVDDDSGDGTAEVARALLQGRGRVVRAAPKPAGWSGKLWALEQGRREVETPWILLLDADILLQPGLVDAAWRKAREDGLDLLSLMATPRMETFWERLLMPAFVYFFQLLYPFRLSNTRVWAVAAAAGGFVLVRAALLERIGGFGALRGALIDDCTLARHAKQAGARTWIGLSRGLGSVRRNGSLGAIRDMVARTAFTQLGHSVFWLAAATAVMLLVFPVPLWAVATPGLRSAGTVALGAMVLSYVPLLRYYGRSPLWAFALPAVGLLYLWMTWVSALRHWRGRGAAWRGRHYPGRPFQREAE